MLTNRLENLFSSLFHSFIYPISFLALFYSIAFVWCLWNENDFGFLSSARIVSGKCSGCLWRANVRLYACIISSYTQTYRISCHSAECTQCNAMHLSHKMFNGNDNSHQQQYHQNKLKQKKQNLAKLNQTKLIWKCYSILPNTDTNLLLTFTA